MGGVNLSRIEIDIESRMSKGPKRRTQEERSSETRTQILEAAVRCPSANGFWATTTFDVAKEAGVSRGALQYHFKSRTALMLAVVKIVFENDAIQLAEFLEGAPRTHEDLMQNMWRSLSSPGGV